MQQLSVGEIRESLPETKVKKNLGVLNMGNPLS